MNITSITTRIMTCLMASWASWFVSWPVSWLVSWLVSWQSTVQYSLVQKPGRESSIVVHVCSFTINRYHHAYWDSWEEYTLMPLPLLLIIVCCANSTNAWTLDWEWTSVMCAFCLICRLWSIIIIFINRLLQGFVVRVRSCVTRTTS